MHEIRITVKDTVYAAFEKRANRLGNVSAEDLMKEIIESEASEIDASGLFTNERLAVIDRAVEEADQGNLKSIEQVEEHLDIVRGAWHRENAS